MWTMNSCLVCFKGSAGRNRAICSIILFLLLKNTVLYTQSHAHLYGFMMRVCEKGWQNGRMTDRITEWQTIRQNDRETDKMTEWQTDRQSDRQNDRVTDWQTKWQSDRLTEWQTKRRSDRLTEWPNDRQTDRTTKKQTEWQRDRQNDRQSDKEKVTGGQTERGVTDKMTETQTEWRSDRKNNRLTETDRMTEWHFFILSAFVILSVFKVALWQSDRITRWQSGRETSRTTEWRETDSYFVCHAS